jgi:hypothetical protein
LGSRAADLNDAPTIARILVPLGANSGRDIPTVGAGGAGATRDRRGRGEELVGQLSRLVAVQVYVDEMPARLSEQQPDVARAAEVPGQILEVETEVLPPGAERAFLPGGHGDDTKATLGVGRRG